MQCEICKSREATEQHHMLSQSKLYKRLYGDLIHDERNIMYVCELCHKWNPVPKFTEIEFCIALDIVPRSKSALLIWERMKGEK